MKNALLLAGHGSREKGFQNAMVQVARALKKEGKFDWVGCAYNEISKPLITEAIETLAKNGTETIYLLPYFLQAGRHVKRDIPELVRELQKKYSGRIKIILCPYLGYDPRLVEIVKKRIKEV